MAARHAYEFGSFRLNPAERQLLCEDKPVALTPKCFDLLVVLVENRGHLVKKEELIERLWPNQFVEESNLSFNISTLRKALGEGHNGQRFIETVPKKGFRFVAPVTALGGSERGAVVDETATKPSKSDEEFQKAPAEFHQAAPIPVVVNARRLSRQSMSLRIALFVLAVGILGLLSYGLSRKPVVTPAAQPLKTIAVLPFKPLSSDSRDESLEMGMTETLITRLGNVNQIVVRPMSAVRKYTNPQQDPVKIGQELQAEAVLDGSIQKSGDRVRVTVRLTNVRTGMSLWADQFDESFTDIFKVQDSISERVTKALPLKLNAAENARLAKHYTENPEAYELYLQGQYLSTKRTKDDLEKSIAFFEQSLEKDRKFGLAYIAMAEAQMSLVGTNRIPANEGWPKAIAALTKALELDDTLAEAHNTLAEVKYQYEFDWAGAEKEFKKALDLNSNLSMVRLAFGWYLMSLGRFDEASKEMERAQELDPRSMGINRARGRLLYFMRQYDRALGRSQKLLEVEPNSSANHWVIAQVYEQKGMYSEAVREYSQLTAVDGVSLSPEEIEAGQEAFKVSGWLGFVKTRNALLLSKARDAYVSPFSIASNYARLGDRDQTFAWFEKAIDQRASGVTLIKIWPLFDVLRSDPRYAKLLRRMNLTP